MTAITRLAALASAPWRRVHDLVPSPRRHSGEPEGIPASGRPSGPPEDDDLLDSLGFTAATD